MFGRQAVDLLFDTPVPESEGKLEYVNKLHTPE